MTFKLSHYPRRRTGWPGPYPGIPIGIFRKTAASLYAGESDREVTTWPRGPF
jgi:hypothetical protein